ncbi:MAG: redoxin family protein [Candidatus Nanoarchaeia archaeon]
MLRRKAPPLLGIKAWINTKPLKIEDLEGKVVVIDFWTYSCVNCLRSLVKLKKLWEAYKDKGLIILGVHTPEFKFESDEGNVEEACKRLGVEWPVALDADYQTWNAYQNHYWPHHFLVDTGGYIIWDHKGEGGEAELEEEIRKLLKVDSDPVVKVEAVVPEGPITPETYCGKKKNPGLGSVQACTKEGCDHADPEVHSPGVLYPLGSWVQEEEYLESKGGTLIIPYTAGEANLVFEGSGEIEVLLDGKAVPLDKRGKHVVEKGGKTVVVVDHPDMYNLVKGSVGTHELSLKIPKGMRAYAYTFA